MTTNLDVAAEAIAVTTGLSPGQVKDESTAALDAIDPRLKLLTPDDVTAILDFFKLIVVLNHRWPASVPAHVREVLS